MKKCNHTSWEHKIRIGDNMSGNKCLWLTHVCKKCKLESDYILIKQLEEKK